jgi:hypothetical protein
MSEEVPQDISDSKEKVEAQSDDTRPIWERVLEEITKTRRELCRRLDRVYDAALEERAAIRNIVDRIEKLEQKLAQVC